MVTPLGQVIALHRKQCTFWLKSAKFGVSSELEVLMVAAMKTRSEVQEVPVVGREPTLNNIQRKNNHLKSNNSLKMFPKSVEQKCWTDKSWVNDLREHVGLSAHLKKTWKL